MRGNPCVSRIIVTDVRRNPRTAKPSLLKLRINRMQHLWASVVRVKRLLLRSHTDSIIARKIVLSRQLNAVLHSTVRYGPFKGLVLTEDMRWGETDRASMLLGMYESEVLGVLQERLPDRDVFINVGAADGYYGIGVLVGGMFATSYCYEASDEGRRIIERNALRNGVADRLVIRGRASCDFLDAFSDEMLSKAVLLMDIEGGEFDLLEPRQLERLRRTVVVVEMHEGFVDDGASKADVLRSLAEDLFDVTVLKTGARAPGDHEELARYCDADRWLIASEGRPYLMSWLRLNPRPSDLSAAVSGR